MMSALGTEQDGKPDNKKEGSAQLEVPVIIQMSTVGNRNDSVTGTNDECYVTTGMK